MCPVPVICPVGSDELAVTRLHCSRCGTSIEGLFTLGRFHYLTREQQQFIGIFIKCRGKIKDVEQELGISYPTVVRLLDELVQALGFAETPEPAPAVAAEPEPAIAPEQQRAILDDLSQGRISSTEALRLLRGEGPTGTVPAAAEEPAPAAQS